METFLLKTNCIHDTAIIYHFLKTLKNKTWRYWHECGFPWLIITGSRLDDWIYWHFFTTAHNQCSAEPFLLDSWGLSPFCFLFYDWLQTNFVVPYKTSARTTHRKHIENTLSTENLFASPRNGVLTKNLSPRDPVFDTLPSNGRPVVVTRLSGKLFIAPLAKSGCTNYNILAWTKCS
jgi:hypothetical protein